LVAEVPNRHFGSRVTTRAELNEILQYSRDALRRVVSEVELVSFAKRRRRNVEVADKEERAPISVKCHDGDAIK
jgi:transposase